MSRDKFTATRLLAVLACLLTGVALACATLAYGPKRLVYCQDADALSDFYRWAAEGTVGIVHVDGGAGYYPSCYAPSVLAWWIALALILCGVATGAYLAAKGRDRSPVTP